MADEREHGQRAILNLGHTFGHALEAITNYGQLLHGQAVSIGMVMACELAQLEGICDVHTAERVRNLLHTYGLPIKAPKFDKARFLATMAMDKKVVNGSLHFVLPSAIGSVRVTNDYDPQHLDAVLRA